MTQVQPIPKPKHQVKSKRSRVLPEQYERICKRASGVCECGCGIPFTFSDPLELHHIFPKGLGGRPYFTYQDWQLMGIRRSCHDKEEAAGYPHRHSWIEMMKEKDARYKSQMSQ
jgi:5-methylcytosine-specific restriction endonuclease McrA